MKALKLALSFLLTFVLPMPAESQPAAGSSAISPISVPYKFRDHEINRTSQSIHYEIATDSVTIVCFDTSMVSVYPDKRITTARWDSVADSNGVRQRFPSVKSRVSPEYPGLARRVGIEGKIIVKAFLQREGPPSKCLVMQSGSPVFEQPVLDALKQWDFRPAESDLSPHGIWAVLEFDFFFQNGQPTVMIPH